MKRCGQVVGCGFAAGVWAGAKQLHGFVFRGGGKGHEGDATALSAVLQVVGSVPHVGGQHVVHAYLAAIGQLF